MKKALNQHNIMVNIIESKSTDTYTCPICHEELIRKFGAQKQYYAHQKDTDSNVSDCETKMKLIIKDDKCIPFQEDQLDILHNEFYNKKFDKIQIEMSDYLSEEGYYLTQEQKDIIFSKEDKVKVSALAGAAKSSTLYYYAKERPFNRILYLVYNKSMKDESEKLFSKQKHVDIKTIHGLAYGYVGKYYRDKLTFNYGVVDIIKDLNLNWNRDMELAVKIAEMMKQYMLSSAQEFEDLEIYKEDDLYSKILSCCHKLWNLKKSYKNNIKVEHDYYLKLFQLSQTDLSNKYDIILLDESQDSSLMMFDIITNSNVKGIVVVGDKYQALYSWRNSINIMPLFKAKEYKLTTSFRVSQNIAHVSNLIISDFIGDDIQMKGFNIKQKIVDKIDKSKPYACLCRTNAYIFSEIAEALGEDKNKKLFFEGGYQSYNFNNLKDCYYYSQGHPTKNKIFAKFKDFMTMKEYAENTEDIELLSLIRMVDKYGRKIIDIVDGIKNNAVTNKDKADILFSTCHRAKGMTYSMPVYISNDHLDLESIYKKKYITPEDHNSTKDISEEVYICYVAVTRCFGEIELSDSIKKYLLLRHKTIGHKLYSLPFSSHIT